MTKGRMLFLILASFFLLLAAAPHKNIHPATASDDLPSQSLLSGSTATLAVCQGTFALCTEAVCDPVITTVEGKKHIEFSCKCKAQTGYSLGVNLSGPRHQCQSVPTEPLSAGQKIPSRYAPIKSYVACKNQRPWAQCVDAPCVVDRVDKNDPTKGTATCACPIATGSPYLYVPPDGKYNERGCNDEYISSATVDDASQITEFLTTPAGKNLPPTLPIQLVPTLAPTPAH